VNGLRKRIDYPDFVEHIHLYDIFCIVETHIDSCDVVNIDGYSFLSKNRMQPYKRKSGGIGIYVKELFFQIY
jgi:hypothetical protein